MNTNTNTNRTPVPSIVTASVVPEANRLTFLSRHFGGQMMAVEQELFAQMRELCADYNGGYFSFYDLSNGGCFIALETTDPLKIAVDGNGYEGTMSAEAAGIVATLFALNHLSFRFLHVERLTERYHQLRDFAGVHAEAGAIFAAID